MIVYIPCFIQYYNRFLARVVLVPFAHCAPGASIDTLDEILGECLAFLASRGDPTI